MSFADLPTELMSLVCAQLDKTDILSVRHTSRQTMATSLDAFNSAMDTLTFTYSDESLRRIHAILNHTDENAQCLSRVTKVIIHTPTVGSLCALARHLEQGRKSAVGDQVGPIERAYSVLPKSLIMALDRLPDLEVVTITNKRFKNDPVQSVPWPYEIDPISEIAPRLHAYESALSILPFLIHKDIELRLTIDPANNRGLDCGLPYSLSPTIEASEFTKREQLIRRSMFGTEEFCAHGVILKYLRRLTFDHTQGYLNQPYGSLIHAAKTSQLTHVTFRGVRDLDGGTMSDILRRDFGTNTHKITHLRIVDCDVRDIDCEGLPGKIPSLQSLEILDSSVHLCRPSGDAGLFARLEEVMAGRHFSVSGTEIKRPHCADDDELHCDSDSDFDSGSDSDSDRGSDHGDERDSIEELRLVMAACSIRLGLGGRRYP